MDLVSCQLSWSDYLHPPAPTRIATISCSSMLDVTGPRWSPSPWSRRRFFDGCLPSGIDPITSICWPKWFDGTRTSLEMLRREISIQFHCTARDMWKAQRVKVAHDKSNLSSPKFRLGMMYSQPNPYRSQQAGQTQQAIRVLVFSNKILSIIIPAIQRPIANNITTQERRMEGGLESNKV